MENIKIDSSNIAIIIPTYNAHAGIVETVLAIKKHVAGATVFVVDDNSPDGTANIVRSKFKNDKRIRLILRANKQGRGSAVIAGFKESLRLKNFLYFIEMDSDMCHNPKYILDLVTVCSKADIAIASRYLPSSKIYGWSFERKIMSYSINHLAKILLRIPISDYTDGYRCYSRKVVNFICKSQIKSHGYIVLSEVAYICYKENFKFAEIPISFHFKPVSKSNLNFNEIKEALVVLLKLRTSQ